MTLKRLPCAGPNFLLNALVAVVEFCVVPARGQHMVTTTCRSRTGGLLKLKLLKGIIYLLLHAASALINIKNI